MRRLLLLFCALALLTSCRSVPEGETPLPAPTETPAPTTPTLESWQESYLRLLQPDERKARAAAREEETGFRSSEEGYCLYDVDGDGLPELLLLYREMGGSYFDVYTCPEGEGLFAGRFYGGRVSANLYSRPEENGVLSEAVRADPIGETHWWRRFRLEKGTLEETELLDDIWQWGEGAPVKGEEPFPDAQLLELMEISDVRPIEEYPAWRRAAELYARFIGDDLPAWRDGVPRYFCESPQDHSALADGLLTVRDLTGDGVPELCYQNQKMSQLLLWTIEEDRVTLLYAPDVYGTDTLLPNGGILSHSRSWASQPMRNIYAYYWFSPESRELPEIVFSSSEDGGFSINGTEVSQTEWEERTAPYRALQEEESLAGLPFQNWAGALNVTVPAAPSPTVTEEEAALLYARFLQDDLTADILGEKEYHSDFYYGLDMERTLELYRVKDLTGDGVPELYNNYPGFSPIWSIKDGRIIRIGGTDTYTKIAPNGGYLYHRPGGGDDTYWYEWLSPESKALPEASFSDWHSVDGPSCYVFNSKEVTQEEWEALTAPYLALEGEEDPYFREWAASLEVELPPPERNEAKALRIYTNELRMPLERDEVDYYALRVWDLDGDGVPELYSVVEPFPVYGIVGLHMEKLGVLADFGGAPKEAVPFASWKKQLLEVSPSGKEIP